LLIMVAGGALSALLLGNDGAQSAAVVCAHHAAGPEHSDFLGHEGLLLPLPRAPMRSGHAFRSGHGLQTVFTKDEPEKTDDVDSIEEVDEREASEQVMEEYEKEMTTLGTYVKDLAKSATRTTERAGALAEQVRYETLDEEISRASQDVQDIMEEVPWQMRAANPSIHQLYNDREALRSLVQEGGRVDPLVEKRVIADIERHSTEALESLEPSETSLKVARNLYDAAERHAALAPPILRETEVHMKEQGLNEEHENAAPESEEGPTPQEALEKLQKGEPDAPKANTSAGCNCDDQVQCSLQGRSFNWCRVGGGRCSILQEDKNTVEAGGAPREPWIDPSGVDHRLYSYPGAYPASGTHQQQSGAVWDYCTPQPKQPKGYAPRTAHGGRCAWRGDLYERYEKDEAFDSKSGVIDLDKIPERDRLALEVMSLYKASPKTRTLCMQTENSGPYAVCPVAPDPDNPEAAHGGWLADRSWDFCTDRTWKPTAKGEQPPLMPAMPTLKELRKMQREAEKAKMASGEDDMEAVEDAAPSPLVTLGLFALQLPPPRPIVTATPARASPGRPVAPPLRPPPSLRAEPRGLAPPPQSQVQRLASFFPELPWEARCATHLHCVPKAMVACRQ